VCVSILCDGHIVTKSPNNTFLRTSQSLRIAWLYSHQHSLKTKIIYLLQRYVSTGAVQSNQKVTGLLCADLIKYIILTNGIVCTSCTCWKDSQTLTANILLKLGQHADHCPLHSNALIFLVSKLANVIFASHLVIVTCGRFGEMCNQWRKWMWRGRYDLESWIHMLLPLVVQELHWACHGLVQFSWWIAYGEKTNFCAAWYLAV
jgi:hypothetical protein